METFYKRRGSVPEASFAFIKRRNCRMLVAKKKNNIEERETQREMLIRI